MPGVCGGCLLPVYYAEEMRCLGQSWHKLCVRCRSCARVLEPGAMLEHDQQIYCKTCYRTHYGPKGYGFGGVLAKDFTPSPETVKEEKVESPRSGGGWVSPRLIRATRRMVDEANLKSEEVRKKSTDYWPGGFAPASLDRASLRKVSAGFGSGVSGVAPAKSLFKHFEQLSLDNSDNNKQSESNSDEKVKKIADVIETEPNTYPAQLGLRRTFPANISSSPSPSLSDIPRGGYKPKNSPWKGSTAPSCARCCLAVYQAEQYRASGLVWHRACFTCEECGKLLDSTTQCDRGGQIYCNKCYRHNFGPKGVGYGITNLQTS